MIEEIKKIVKGEVSSDEKELFAYSRDASIFEVNPRVIVKPQDLEDIKNIVNFVLKNKSLNPELSITARAGGSDMSGGPLNDSIILDTTKYLNRILEVSADTSISVGAGFVITQPGVFYRDFEKETLKKGLILPSYPASRELCAIGGMVANNSGGEKSLSYGKTDKYVEELNVVLGDGNEYLIKPLGLGELELKKSQNDFEGDFYKKMYELIDKNYELIKKSKPDVSKNSAGYALWDIFADRKFFDLTKLFVGSQGTLGVITKIKFRLIKPARYSKLLVVFVKKMDNLGELVLALNGYKPESMESYDDNTFKLALKIFPDLINRVGIMSLFKFIPDVWQILTGGTPKLIILTEFSGDNEKEIREKIKQYQKEIVSKFKVKTRLADSSSDVKKYWTIRRESFNLLRKHIKGKKTAPFIDDIIVRPEYLPSFLPELNKILDAYKDYMTYTIAGHPGDGNFHIIPLMDLSDERSKQIIPEVSEKVYSLTLNYKGSITAEHNDGLIRTPYLEKMYGTEVCELFNEVKKIFDPQNIFNPGKKVSGSLQYSLGHIIKE